MCGQTKKSEKTFLIVNGFGDISKELLDRVEANLEAQRLAVDDTEAGPFRIFELVGKTTLKAEVVVVE